jgi:hypothetical protein
MASLWEYLRRVVPALAGFLLGAVLYRLIRGTWTWDVLAGALFGAAIILLITLARARVGKT